MLYRITQPYTSNYKIKLTGTGFQFRFSLKNLMFFESGSLMSVQDVEFIPYYPTTEEQGQLLTEYQDWCTQFEQEQNAELISLLTDVTKWKEAKLLDLSKVSAKFEDNKNNDMYFTSVLGFRCNGDRRTATNIAGLISTYDLPPNSSKEVQYRDYDNEIQSLNKEQLQTLYLEHLANGNNLYQQKWTKEESIKAATSLDELNAVSLDFEMANFTPLVSPSVKPANAEIASTIASMFSGSKV